MGCECGSVRVGVGFSGMQLSLGGDVFGLPKERKLGSADNRVEF